MNINKIGVVGCGVTGSSFAQVLATSGYELIVHEIADDLLVKGLALIESRLIECVKANELSPHDMSVIRGRIKGTTDIQDFSNCDLIIEAVSEKMGVKKEVFKKLDEICPKHALFATNTSVLSIQEIASVTNRPEKVIGFHANLLMSQVVEIIKTRVTSNETIKTGKNLAKSVGKDYVIVQDSPGFIISRLTASFFCNAIHMLEDEIADKTDIDKAMTASIGLPLGPFEMMDAAGLDTILLGCQAIYENIKEAQYKPPSLLKRMVAEGRLGCKTGRGFYDYNK